MRYGDNKQREDRVMASGSTPRRMMDNRSREYAPPRWGSNKGHLPLNEALGDPSGLHRPKSETEELMMLPPGHEPDPGPTADIDGVRAVMEDMFARFDQREQWIFHFLFGEGLSWGKTALAVEAKGFECTKWQVRRFEARYKKILKERLEEFL